MKSKTPVKKPRDKAAPVAADNLKDSVDSVKKGAAAGAKKAQKTPVEGTAQRGRPARLSRQVVIAKTMELLEKKLPEEITLAVLAEELNTATVSLYKYFPNRDAVLDAVAEHFFSLFEFPAARRNQRWQDTALDWLWAVHRHIQRHPLVPRMYGVDGQTSTAMMKMCAPLHRLLENQNMQGEALAFAASWFINHALGLIFNEVSASDYRQPIALRHMVDLPPEDQETYLALRPYVSTVKSSDVLEFGFKVMIAGLEELLARKSR
jgi:AcrR family transcriptional regulator